MPASEDHALNQHPAEGRPDRRLPARLQRLLLRPPRELPGLIWKNLTYPFTAQAAEARFDRRMGIDTAGYLAPFELGLPDRGVAHSTGYGATPPKVFRHLIAQLGHPLAGRVFIDVGAGKGRVLLLAARYPFDRVIGLELSPRLLAIARQNIARTGPAARPSGLAAIESVEADATEYDWPNAPSVLFLFNPLGPLKLREFADRLHASLRAHPRPLSVIYYHPKHAEVFDPAIFRRRDIGDIPRDPTDRHHFGATVFEARE